MAQNKIIFCCHLYDKFNISINLIYISGYLDSVDKKLADDFKQEFGGKCGKANVSLTQIWSHYKLTKMKTR
jgi:hypothetical protein